jgi:hypothetical protein
MPERPARWLRVVVLAAVAANSTIMACRASRPAAPLSVIVVPGVPPESALLVRGTADAAGSLTDDDQTSIVDRILTNYYFPPDNQARWLDPRPLAHVRLQAADDTVGADPDFADEVIKMNPNSRTCVLGGRDFNCRGRKGGIVRLSWPYKVGKDSAVVFGIYTPRDSAGVAGKPEPERQFRLRFNPDGYWEMRRSVLVNPSDKRAP